MYSGSPYKFTTFKSNEIEVDKDDKEFKSRFWFITNRELAETYSRKATGNIGTIYEAFLNIKNPRYDFNLYAEDKEDGSIELRNRKIWVAIATLSEQIKLADGTNTTFDGNNADIRFKDGGSVAGTYSRFRPTQTTIFNPPLVGVNGNKLISYTWKYTWTVDFNKNKGEEKEKRISDWTQAEQSAETGRDLVHTYAVEKPTGEVITVSSESVPVILGFTNKEQKKVFGNLATASKTLAKQEMQLAILEAQEQEFLNAQKELENQNKPEVSFAKIDDLPFIWKKYYEESPSKKVDRIYFKMGDIVQEQYLPYGKEIGISDWEFPEKLNIKLTTNTINNLEESWVSKRLAEKGLKRPYGIIDLKNRINRQKTKVENMLATQKFEKGGLLAPNGKPSNLTHEQYKLVRTPEFKEWFGDWENDPENASKVVDSNGEPLVVYHGTNKNFNEFKKSKQSSNIDKSGLLGFFFTPSLETAETFSKSNIVKSCFLNFKNPSTLNARKFTIINNYKEFQANLISEGFDSVMIPKFNDEELELWVSMFGENNLEEYLHTQYVAFEPNQIKLADGSNTTFDGNNPDIRFKKGGNIPTQLYHYTSEINFDRILDSNILKPSEKYGNRLSFTSDSEYHKNEHGLDSGNTKVRIAFDNEKLLSDGYSFSPFDHSSKQNKLGKELEYVISRPIKNVKRYIKDITIFKGNAIVGEVDKSATDYANKYYLESDIKYEHGGLLAPNGKQSNLTTEQYKLVRTPEFKAWFGDWENDPENASKVVDSNGEPLVVYHGSQSSFTVFDKSKGGKSNNIASVGYWFTPLKNFAENFAESVWYGEKKLTIYAVFLSIKNLKKYSSEDNSKITPKLREKIEELNLEAKKIARKWDFGYESYENVNAFTLAKNGRINEENLEYYSTITPTSNLAMKDGKKVKEITDEIKKQKDQLSELYFSDSYQKFRTDIHKTEGGDAETANIGGLGMSLKNQNTVEKYKNQLIENGFGGILIENTKFDSSDAGGINDQYIAFEPNQIKLADGTNTTFDPNSDDIRYRRGGRTVAQTPAPSKERIYGSDRNKPRSSKDSSSAESINFDNKTLTSIENKVEEHNEAHPDKKVNLATAKAVVRRGMGAYSKSHRPTISGGQPNSRVAWGLARLNAFLYKVVNGVSKSGKYSQDNDLLDELGIAHKKFAEGGNTEDDKITKVKQLLRNSFDYLEDDLELLGKGLNGMAFLTVIDGELWVAKYTKSLTEFWLSQMAMVSNPPHVVTIKDVKKLSDNFEYGIIHKYTDNEGVPNKAVWNVAIGIKFKEYLEAQKSVPPKEKEYVRNLAIKLSSEVQDYFGGITIDTSNDNWGYEDGKLVLFDIDGNVKKAQYEEWMQKHSSSKLKKGGKIPKKSKGGDCYVVAGRIALNNRLPNVKTREFVGEPYVIHAQVTGQGAIAGLKYGHAWVEDDIYVYDYSNGRELKIPKEVYYKLGQVIEQQPIYFKYTFGEAKRKMAETGHFGSWDLITESGL